MWCVILVLQGNFMFCFFGLQLGWIGFGLQGVLVQGWQCMCSFGCGFVFCVGNSYVLQVFYSGVVCVECGVGCQVVQLVIQCELYGDVVFDVGFVVEELLIGIFFVLYDIDSILFGVYVGDFFVDGKVVCILVMGWQVFVGVFGFIEYVYDKGMLDDLSNQVENFVVVEVGEGVVQVLVLYVGLVWYDQCNVEFWKLVQDILCIGQCYFECLLFECDLQLCVCLVLCYYVVLVCMDQLLDDLFYQQFVIYVYLCGICFIGYYIVCLFDCNLRMLFLIDLVVYNLYIMFYWCWCEV